MTFIDLKFLKKRRQLSLSNEKGQAAIEYILILVVVVGVILGTLYQFNKAMQVWADNYFGDYLSCLLETGELPALGGTAGTCNEQYKAFSIEDGRPLVGSGGSGDDGSDADGDSTSGSSAGTSGVSGGGRGGSGSANGEGFGSSANRFRARSSASSSSDDGDSSGGSETGSATVTNLSGYEKGRVVRIPVRSRTGPSGAWISDKKNERQKFSASALDRGETPAPPPQLIKVNRTLASPDINLENEEMSFGRFFRILLMAAILIAVIVFLGGQILQASKSME